MTKLLWIALFGGCGAITRYGISLFANQFLGAFPLGTLTVNVLGCFLFGVIAFMPATSGLFSPEIRPLFLTGFLGALTTFSTFSYEGLTLFNAGNNSTALLSIALNVFLCFAAVFGGSLIGKAI